MSAVEIGDTVRLGHTRRTAKVINLVDGTVELRDDDQRTHYRYAEEVSPLGETTR